MLNSAAEYADRAQIQRVTLFYYLEALPVRDGPVEYAVQPAQPLLRQLDLSRRLPPEQRPPLGRNSPIFKNDS
jgi:hypothetical protein